MYIKPKPTNTSRKNIEELARKFALRVGYNKRDCMISLVKKIGGKVIISAGETSYVKGGTIIARGVSDFKIYVPSLTSCYRDKVTIAQGIGHLLLHLPTIKKDNKNAIMCATRSLDHEDEDQMRAEMEANWFAAELLMPEKEFREFCNTSSRTTDEISVEFDVSNTTADVRRRSLNST